MLLIKLLHENNKNLIWRGVKVQGGWHTLKRVTLSGIPYCSSRAHHIPTYRIDDQHCR